MLYSFIDHFIKMYNLSKILLQMLAKKCNYIEILKLVWFQVLSVEVEHAGNIMKGSF